MDQLDRLLSIPLPETQNGARQTAPPANADPDVRTSSVNTEPLIDEAEHTVVQEERIGFEESSTLNAPELPATVIPYEPEKAMAGFIGDDSEGSTKLLIFALAIIIGGVVITSLLILDEPLTAYARARSFEAEKELLDEEEQKRYAALENDVVATMRMIDERMERLNCDAKALGVKAEHYFGAPLEYLQLHPPERPRELDLAILESDTLALHWSGVANAALRDYPPAHLHLPLQDIRRRIDTRELLPADRRLLAELLSLIELEERFAFERGHHLHAFAGLMDALRFENNLSKYERNH